MKKTKAELLKKLKTDRAYIEKLLNSKNETIRLMALYILLDFTKECTSCHEIKSAKEFYRITRKGKTYLHPRCMVCLRKERREYYKGHALQIKIKAAQRKMAV